MRVLIADDDRVFVHLLSSRFRKRGWQVMQAFDAMQAVMFAGRSPHPDVIVLDLGMPGGTGFSVLEKLHRSAATSSIPVIVVTGSETEEEEERARKLGVAGFFRKPVDPSTVIEEAEEAAGASSNHG